jgi:hypothetical protein
MADSQRCIDFQDGGGGHLDEYRYTSGFAFYGLSMFFSV